MRPMQPTLSRTTAFQGRAIRVDVLEVAMPDGRSATRELVQHRGAAAILGRRPDGKFVLVRQYRKAVEEDLIEVIAGSLEIGEDPAVCARREVREETGYTVARLVPLGIITACPGYSSELLHLFYAELDPQPGVPEPDPDEGVGPVVLSAEDVDAAIADGRIHDSKTLATWLLWKAKHACA